MVVRPVLDDARAKVVPALRSAVESVSPELRAVVDYHMGWRDQNGNPVARQSSKGVRPALTLLGAAAADPTRIDRGVPGAVAVEAMHNCAFLLDDVMDGDRYRRQRETAWVHFGKGQSTLAGNALLLLGITVLQRAESADRSRAALDLYLETVNTMFAGQAVDLQTEGGNGVTVDGCMAMVRMKTASLMRCASTIGAVLAGGSPELVAALSTYGEAVGVAFQARDDLLGIWGEPHQTGGRPRGFDLRARKGTLPVAFALAKDEAVASELLTLLGRDQLSEEDVVRATQLVEACGGREQTVQLAAAQVDAAIAAIRTHGLPDDLLEGLVEIAEMGRADL